MNLTKNIMTNCLLLMLILSAMFFLGAPVSAQESEDKGVNNASQSQVQKEKEKKPSQSTPQEKVFKPSEQISEDSPVPFPVDI